MSAAPFCEFGSCKRKQRVRVAMLNLKTRETRDTHVCREHLRDVLSACEKQDLLASIEPMKGAATGNKAEGRA